MGISFKLFYFSFHKIRLSIGFFQWKAFCFIFLFFLQYLFTIFYFSPYLTILYLFFPEFFAWYIALSALFVRTFSVTSSLSSSANTTPILHVTTTFSPISSWYIPLNSKEILHQYNCSLSISYLITLHKNFPI